MTKVILITGASSGLGKATASYLLAKNFRVYGTSRDPKKYSFDKSIELLPFDLNQPESAQQLVDELMEKAGRIDVLINNAGAGIIGPVEEIDATVLNSHFSTNLFGPLALIQRVIPVMREQGSGLIINVTSIAGYMGLPFRGIYSASKGALGIASEALRMEVKRFGIDVVTLAPGDYATDIAARRIYSPLKKESPYHDLYKSSLETIDEHVDQGGDPNDFARMVNKIIRLKKRKVHYKSGSFLQKLSLLLKRILPDTVFEKMIMNHYKV
ncbi:SDR family oxidoreductase [Flavobacteriaceae bacterium]|nr:SDR family oxidoreductase [Flavobacteriaceae bacterium]MDA8763171.1 SDR family oxidoreductase [Flavobacteriaceae bacterium]MDC3238550.1 SDR family oxidoreductase [Flavobacteriaceae bacterium]